MSRLRNLALEDLDPDQRALLEEIQSGPRGARHGTIGLVGPFGIWVRHPGVGRAIQAVGAAVRFETSLPETVKEIAICTVGAHFKAKFEFAAHRRLAMEAGVGSAALDSILNSESVSTGDDAQDLCYRLTSQLLNEWRVETETYDRARELWGEKRLIELVSIIGYYCLVCMTLNLFEIPIPPGMEDPFPDLP